MVLEHNRALGARTCDFAVCANQVTLGRCGQTRDEIEQGGLAATRVANQSDELSFGYVQVDVAQCGKVAFGGFKGLGNALNFQILGGQSFAHDFTSS